MNALTGRFVYTVASIFGFLFAPSVSLGAPYSCLQTANEISQAALDASAVHHYSAAFFAQMTAANALQDCLQRNPTERSLYASERLGEIVDVRWKICNG